MYRNLFQHIVITLGFGFALLISEDPFRQSVALAGAVCKPVVLAVTLPPAAINQPYSATIDGDGGAGPYTLVRKSGALPNGISFNNGVFSGTPTQPGSFTVQIEATDSNGCTGTEDVTLVVNCPAIDLTPATLSAGTYGAAYPATTFTPVGGVAPFTFTVTGLPAGMSFSTTTTNVTIGGTPTQSGSFNVVVKATDAFTCANATNGRTYPLTINRVTLTVRAENKTKVAGAAQPALTHVVSGFVNEDTAAVLSGAPALTTAATANSNAGTYPITITPGTLGAANYNFSFVNGALTVTCPTIDLLPKPTGPFGGAAFALPAATLNQNYKTTISVLPSGGNPQFTVIAAPNLLPGGLTLDATTGVISGKPTVTGTFTFRIQGTTFGTCVGSRLYSLRVNAPTALTGASASGSWQ